MISSGGGIVISRTNRKMLKEKCFCIWLLISPDIAATRIQNTVRPLVGNTNTLQKMKELNKSREPYYAELAELGINVGIRNIKETVDRLYEEYSSVK